MQVNTGNQNTRVVQKEAPAGVRMPPMPCDAAGAVLSASCDAAAIAGWLLNLAACADAYGWLLRDRLVSAGLLTNPDCNLIARYTELAGLFLAGSSAKLCCVPALHKFSGYGRHAAARFARLSAAAVLHGLRAVAVGEAAILLHRPLPLVHVSVETTRECQQNDSPADG